MNGLASDGPRVQGSNRRVKLDVGGKIFETTTSTLQSAGKTSLLARSALSTDSAEIFFDRDPHLFALLLGVLRTGKLSASTWEKFDIEALIDEASYYGILEPVKKAMAPEALDGIDVERVSMVVPNGRDYPLAICSSHDGSVWVGHGSKITPYDWALRKQTTTLTDLHSVDTMNRISETLAAVGAEDFPGLHIYDTKNAAHVKSLTWSDKSDTRVYKPCVRALASSDSSIFASFENGQRTENTILVVDKERLEVSREIGRQSGNSAHSKVSTILQFVNSENLLMVGGVHGGTFGFSGYIRLFDARADKIVWDWTEPNANADPRMIERDSFADVVVSEDLGAIVKVNVMRGNLAMADLRRLSESRNPWMPLTETNPALAVQGGTADAKIVSYGRQIFCSRGEDLEVWSEVPVISKSSAEVEEKKFRRNFVEHSRRGHQITSLSAGGDRLFVARWEMQGVEVWETKG